MNPVRHIRRLGVAPAGLAGAVLAVALFAATIAVLADRAWAARRTTAAA